MRTAFLAAALTAALFLPSGSAGTAVRLDIEDLVEHAALVIEGRVVTAQSYATAGGRVETEYFVSVHRTYLGTPYGTQVFRLPGGVLQDGSGMVVPGLSELREGQDALLFLTEVGSKGWRMPVGLAQGQLDVVVDQNGERALVRGDAALSLVDPQTGVLAPHAGGAVLDYQATVARVEAAAARKLRGEPANPNGEQR
jgi:hypothetical protein